MAASGPASPSHVPPAKTGAERWLSPDHRFDAVGERIQRFPLGGHTPLRWLAAFGLTLAIVGLMAVSVAGLLYWGVGVWGLNIPVAWGFAITNFVWWIGIGHAGTFISAIALLLRQGWRTSINRLSEAMTIFAVMMAGLFPLFHLGRIWKFYYLFPYPDSMGAWPQWRSPLVWDVFAVMTYFTVSLVFWYLGLVPDLASMRDRSPRKWSRRIAGIFALGWRGSARHWQRHQMLYLLLAGLATPLVVSVHSIVSLDFSVSMLPGWHSTIFPPYFVAGAIYSGFAMVLTIAIPARSILGLKDLITREHLDAMSKVTLVSGLIVAYGYIMEHFVAWYSGDTFEMYMSVHRWVGEYKYQFWTMMACNIGVLQALWFPWVRRNPAPLFVVSLLINVGMWLERYIIVITSLHNDFMPSAWGMYHGNFWDWSLFIGSLGLFAGLTLLFFRFLPSISISEVREQLHKVRHEAGQSDEDADPPAETQRRRETAEPAPLPDDALHGLIAEFAGATALLRACRAARDAGFRKLDAYSPHPLEDLAESLGFKPTRMALAVLIGGVCGASGAYFMQWYAAVISYPWNIGGRPLHSWPSFIPLTFELGVLGGALTGLVTMLIANGLPRLHHPVFDAPGFERASCDRYFLCIERRDDRFDRHQTRSFLEGLAPLRVSEVPTA